MESQGLKVLLESVIMVVVSELVVVSCKARSHSCRNQCRMNLSSGQCLQCAFNIPISCRRFHFCFFAEYVVCTPSFNCTMQVLFMLFVLIFFLLQETKYIYMLFAVCLLGLWNFQLLWCYCHSWIFIVVLTFFTQIPTFEVFNYLFFLGNLFSKFYSHDLIFLQMLENIFSW